MTPTVITVRGQADRESSRDDFGEVRPKAKRCRTSEGTLGYHDDGDLLYETDFHDVVVALINCVKRGKVQDYQNPKKELKNFKENLQSFWLYSSSTPPRIYRLVASPMGLQLVTSS
ncbi:hypothetical protein L6164_010157 [Bauhinia variegata]|uniref:Uncharacterized protein n=1 Tax=Bauhinia variegata TaxID=167791 RepID=A0ACB9PM26_BAUVA|nr:hypothetical protein L6164_010157 [Bauhinia variegata]